MIDDDDADPMPMPMANFFSKEAVLLKRLTHERATVNVRLKVWDGLAGHRSTVAAKNIIYFRIKPDW